MKKITLSALALFVANIFLAQGFKSSFIDPNISSGYITWKNIPDARYEVHVYSKDEQGNEIPIEVIQTEKNFTKLNLNVSIPDVGTGTFFKTIAISKETGGIIDIGIEIEQIGGAAPYYETCHRNCNGINYAWSLQWWQKPDGQGKVYPTRPGKLLLRNAYEYRDADGFGVPYFRAMSVDQYVYWREFEIKKYHDLDEYTILRDIYVTRQDCILDASGVILEGRIYFVEKKTEQWTYMQTNNTDDFNNNYICDANIGYWIDVYNKKSKQTDWYREPLDGEPTDLACIAAKVCGKGGGTSGGGTGGGKVPSSPKRLENPCILYVCTDNTDPDNPKEWMVISCDNNDPCGFGRINPDNPNNDIKNVIKLPEGIDFSTKIVRSYQFERLDEQLDRISFSSENFNSSLLNEGLYRLYVVFDDYSIVPIVFEYNPTNIETYNTYATLNITPNPIKESINMMLSSSKNTDAIINIYTLDGTIVYNEQVTLAKNRKTTKSVNVSNTEVIYNQWRVVVNFPDGTSIHKTVTR
ncbi:MAG: hypothetical protein ACLGGV_07240 [Bacteroidia bacterium]